MLKDTKEYRVGSIAFLIHVRYMFVYEFVVCGETKSATREPSISLGP